MIGTAAELPQVLPQRHRHAGVRFELLEVGDAGSVWVGLGERILRVQVEPVHLTLPSITTDAGVLARLLVAG